MKKKPSVFPAPAAVTITVFSVWCAQRPVAAREAAWDDLLAEARAGADTASSPPEPSPSATAGPPEEFPTGNRGGDLPSSESAAAGTRPKGRFSGSCSQVETPFAARFATAPCQF